MVLVCIMIINPSSSTGSQCKNSINLVFVDIRVEVIYFGRNRGLRPASGYPLMTMMVMMIMDDDDVVSKLLLTSCLHSLRLCKMT